MKLRLLAGLLALVLPTGSGIAVGATAVEPVVNAETPEKLAAVQVSVDEQMAAGGRYEFLSSDGREQVESLFRDMRALLDKSGSVAAMPEDERLALFNLQEKLNGVLAGGDSRRLVCEKTAPTGSLIPVKSCRTYGEMERQRREKDNYLDEVKRQRAQTRHGS